jgi:phosphoribosylaminoimidazole-succinocarboxamide synthase
LFETNMPGLRLRGRGKVRDIYEAGEYLVIVATDRISAFDCILPTPIPGKGRVLTATTLFWLDLLKDIVPNHLVSARVEDYPAEFQPFANQLEGRSMLVRRLKMIEVECVARGYLAGSGWKDYKRTGAICGIALPGGLVESDRLSEPIFTPATKAQSGHDENVPAAEVEKSIGAELTGRLRTLTLALYRRAADYALERGILIADTKFEFGFLDGVLYLGDEVLTPDSSRFWPKETYKPGGPQPSFDKQFVRDWLEASGWNKQPPAPALPAEIAARTAEKYAQAYLALTGRTL